MKLFLFFHYIQSKVLFDVASILLIYFPQGRIARKVSCKASQTAKKVRQQGKSDSKEGQTTRKFRQKENIE
jgi:hypothetical protein